MNPHTRTILAAIALFLMAVLMAMVAQFMRLSPAAVVPVVGLIFVVLIAGITVYSVGTMFRARRYSADLLSELEQTVRLNLPLPRLLERFSHSASGSMARKATAAREALLRGDSVAVVLETLPQFPRRLIPVVEVAERTGRLPQALSRIVRQQRDAARRRAADPGVYRWYPLLIAVVTVVVVGLMMTLVMPRFEQIFQDFGVQLPPTTRLLLAVSRTWGTPIALGTACCAMVGLFIFFGKRRGMGMGLVAGPGETLLNHFPFVGRVRLYRALAEALDFAADGIEAERSAVDSINEAAAITTNARLRAKLEAWTTAIRFGASLTEAARRAELPPMIWRMIAPTAEGGDLTAALRFLAGYYRMRFARRMAIIEAAAPPLLAGVMGLFVAWVALSIISALTVLVDTTIPYPVSL